MKSITASPTAATVVLVSLDTEAMSSVRETLAAEAVLPSAAIPYEDAVDVVRRNRPHAVIVGIDGSLELALSLAQTLKRDAPTTALIALASEGDADQILSTMRVGYREFVVLPADAERLRQVVHDAAFEMEAEEEKGQVIAFCGAKGGVGTTIVCTHTAAELAATHRVLCMDLDFSAGDAASILDLKPRDTLSDLLVRADRLDDRMLNGAVAIHRSKLHVLAQSADLEPPEAIPEEDVYMVLNAAAKAYQYIFLDVGSQTSAIACMALHAADMCVVVTTPDVIAIRNAYRRLRFFETLGIERDSLRLVVNRFSKNPYVALTDIEKSLGLDILTTLADDDTTVDQAINRGKLIKTTDPKSKIANDISRLSSLVTGEGDPLAMAAANHQGGGFLARLFQR